MALRADKTRPAWVQCPRREIRATRKVAGKTVFIFEAAVL